MAVKTEEDKRKETAAEIQKKDTQAKQEADMEAAIS